MQVNRTVKGLVVVMLISIILIGGMGYHNNHTQLVEATENVNRLEQKVEDKDKKVIKLSNRYEDLGEKVDELTAENKELKKEKEAVSEKNEELSNKVESLESKIASAKESVAVKKQVKKQNSKTETKVADVAEAKEVAKASKAKEQKVETKAVSKKTLQLEATMYTAFCDTGCIGITATGVDVSNTIYYKGYRVVAVDPNVIPLNTVMEIEYANGVREKVIAVDTGGAIKGHKIDILVGSKQEALNFGRQGVTVRVLDWG